MTGRRLVAAGVLTVALVATATTFGAHESTAINGVVSVEYQGTFGWSQVPGPGEVGSTASVTWHATAYRSDKVYLGSTEDAVPWKYTTLKGTYTHNGAETCSAVLSERPGYETAGRHDDAAVGLDSTSGPLLFTVQAQVPWDSWALRSSEEPKGPCSFGANGPIGIPAPAGRSGSATADYETFLELLRPKLSVNAAGGSTTKQYNGEWTGAVAGGVKGTLTLTSTLTISAGIAPAISGPTPPEVKAAAARAFRSDFQAALGPCLQTLAGVGVQLTGAVWFVVAAPVNGGIASSAAILSTGQVMTAVGAGLCGPILARLLAEYAQYDDPPRHDYHVVATVPVITDPGLTLPGCTRFSGAAALYCQKLESAVIGWAVAVRRSVAVAQALQATVERESGAAKASDSSALALQKQTALAFLSRQKAADTAEDIAYRTVAQSIKGAGVRGKLDKALSGKAIAGLLRYLTGKKADRATVLELAGLSAKPAVIDLP